MKLKNDVVFISENSDCCITDEQAEKSSKNIIKWFCQNRISHKSLLESITISIENKIECKIKYHGYVWKHAYEKNEPEKLCGRLSCGRSVMADAVGCFG